MAVMKKFPIGIQSFEKLREDPVTRIGASFSSTTHQLESWHVQ